jgi:hypothetical protein
MVESHRPPSKKARTLEMLIVSALASVYLAFWLLETGPVAAPPATSAAPTEPGPPASSEVVWLETLPSSERPPLTLPDGWRLATHDSSVRAERPRSARAPRTVVATRRARIRTRSS